MSLLVLVDYSWWTAGFLLFSYQKELLLPGFKCLSASINWVSHQSFHNPLWGEKHFPGNSSNTCVPCYGLHINTLRWWSFHLHARRVHQHHPEQLGVCAKAEGLTGDLCVALVLQVCDRGGRRVFGCLWFRAKGTERLNGVQLLLLVENVRCAPTGWIHLFDQALEQQREHT